LLELKRDKRGADVAGVKDMVHAGKKLRELGIEKVVRVGDDADFHDEMMREP
jgi:hypothetical protein